MLLLLPFDFTKEVLRHSLASPPYASLEHLLMDGRDGELKDPPIHQDHMSFYLQHSVEAGGAQAGLQVQR